MALDPLERERLRQKMAVRMGIFQESAKQVTCVSSHYLEVATLCDLCQDTHAHEMVVLKNRAGKKMRVDVACLKEMIRFHVTDVEDLQKWLAKFSELRAEHEKRKEALAAERAEERKRLEKKVIVRKRSSELS